MRFRHRVFDQQERILNAGQRIINFMGDARRNTSHRGQGIDFLQRGLGASPSRNITHFQKQLRRPIRSVVDRLHRELNDDPAAMHALHFLLELL